MPRATRDPSTHAERLSAFQRLARVAFALLCASGAAALCQGCVLFGHANPVSLSTDPPGARVMIDKRDSGFVTPCLMTLEPDDDMRIDFELPGYARATRYMTSNHRVYAMLWEDMYIRSEIFFFPLWLNTEDFWVPIKHDTTPSPGRIYVRLERTADSAPDEPQVPSAPGSRARK